MLNRRLQAKKKTAKGMTARIKITLPSDNVDIGLHIECESEKWLKSALVSGASLNNQLWKYGRINRDHTQVEKELHKLIYTRFSQKVRALMIADSKNLESSV